MSAQEHSNPRAKKSFFDGVLRFCLENKLIVLMGFAFLIGWGVMVAPFDWKVGGTLRDPVPVDAIPDLGENQQIVFTKWPGRSPRDIEDQITYPLTVALMGVPGIKTVRSFSYFGFSTVYVIFKEKVDFYWSRSRILERLNALPENTLPKGIKPTLGPDATGLGQIFWYTLEGRDEKGQPAGGWSLHELRKLQDWYVRYSLQSAGGVSEVASIGGFVQQYQVEVNPDRLKRYKLSLADIYRAVREANKEVGARTIEINRVEYVIRARGYIKKLSDLENTVIQAKKGVPVTIKDVATVSLGPAPRRGALDKDGAEAVGGVVVARYGANPLQVIKNVKAKIKEISEGLPKKKLKDGRTSQVKIIPFYDRSKLIKETLYTLEEAISLEILVTILVVVLMLLHFRSSLLIAGSLPIAVLLCFIAMKLFRVDANIVALSGIAIAIGTIVDMGIVLSENILQHLEKQESHESSLDAVLRATSEVAGAVLTAVSTTVISFLPVFAMDSAEGKLFRPLAFTKTFALLASLIVALLLLPPLAHILFSRKTGKPSNDQKNNTLRTVFYELLLVVGAIISVYWFQWVGWLLFGMASLRLLNKLAYRVLTLEILRWLNAFGNIILGIVVALVLAWQWGPLGQEIGLAKNGFFVLVLIGSLLLSFYLFYRFYRTFLAWFLRYKLAFLTVPLCSILLGVTIWLGFEKTWGWLPEAADKIGIDTREWKKSERWKTLANQRFPGLKKEFMPDLDEGSFLLMPTTMPNASIGECLDVLKKLDVAVRSIPEVSMVVGKLGRVESALDPAPISMFENVIHYKAKYRLGPDGRKIRQWRPHIKTPKDIWNEVVKRTKLLGTTSAPYLQPISARIVMLQSGMRAPMGIKVKGPNLETIEKVALDLEKQLKQVPQISAPTVVADRVVGKPYLEFVIHRKAIARYGVTQAQVQRAIEMAIGGSQVTTTVEGRERFSVVVRYPRDYRNHLDALKKILVNTPTGAQIPLFQVASLKYVRGPQVIKSEDTFLVAYVVFDRKKAYGEVETVEAASAFLKSKIKSGELKIPAKVSYVFAGSYQNQIRAEKKLMVVLPLALFLIFLILYLQFRSGWTTSFIFSSILVAWSGGFLMLWLYSQPWFFDVSIFGQSMREVFHIQPFHMSVAVWVGFIALFGIASDDGVVMATYLQQSFTEKAPNSIQDIREATIEAGARRIRPCLMTTATTLLALLPILTSSGRGSDIMIPMAIPSFGGMAIELLTLFVVPVLFCWRKEWEWKREQRLRAYAGGA